MIRFLQKNWIFFAVTLLGILLDIGSKSFAFRYLGGEIFVPEAVASIPSSYSQYMMTGPIANELRQEVSKHISVSEHAIMRATYQKECWLSTPTEHYLLIPGKDCIYLSRSKYEVHPSFDPIATRLLAKQDYKTISVIPHFFCLRLALNLGAVWSSFEGQTLLLILFSIAAMFFVFFLLISHSYPTNYLIALGMIMSGAAGNLWDRLLYRGVRDFLDFYISPYHWPTFNIADCLIIAGVALFIWEEYKADKQKKLATAIPPTAPQK